MFMLNSLRSLLTVVALSLSVAAASGGDTKITKAPVVPAPESWEFKLAVPSWIAGVRGDSGVNGRTSHAKTGFNELVNKLDLLGALRAEAGIGRFGVMADFSYLSLSDSIGTDGVLRKVDFRQDQMLGDLGLRWRLVEGPSGWLDVIGGVHYTYLHEELGLQSNDERIGALSDELSAAVAATGLRVAQALFKLSGKEPQFNIPPLGAGEAARLAVAINRLKGTTAERAKAIEKLLHRSLNRRLTRTDQWLDPYIGLRGRYNFNDKWYAVARADVSPFDIGADFAWQASAGFGLNLTQRVYGELVYRILDVEYRHDGFIYDNTAHGPELTLGISF